MLDFGVLFAAIGPREGVTDRDGNLTLIVDARNDRFWLGVSADDDPEDCDGPRPSHRCPWWGRLVPGPRFALRDEFQVRLFRCPSPTAEVTVPDGYRGAIVVKFVGCDQPPPVVKGQREFTFTASPHGVVLIAEGAFFESVASYDGIRVRYGNGPTLPTLVEDSDRQTSPATPTGDTVALRFITPVREHHTWLYVLGTAAEAEAIDRSVWPDADHFDEEAFQRIVEQR
jgi:hypothetical protein